MKPFLVGSMLKDQPRKNCKPRPKKGRVLVCEEEKNSFESRAKEKRSQKNSKPRVDRGAEYQFVKILKPCAKEEKNNFKSRAKEKRSQKNSKPRVDRVAKHQFVKNSKSHAKEETNRF